MKAPNGHKLRYRGRSNREWTKVRRRTSKERGRQYKVVGAKTGKVLAQFDSRAAAIARAKFIDVQMARIEDVKLGRRDGVVGPF